MSSVISARDIAGHLNSSNLRHLVKVGNGFNFKEDFLKLRKQKNSILT